MSTVAKARQRVETSRSDHKNGSVNREMIDLPRNEIAENSLTAALVMFKGEAQGFTPITIGPELFTNQASKRILENFPIIPDGEDFFSRLLFLQSKKVITAKECETLKDILPSLSTVSYYATELYSIYVHREKLNLYQRGLQGPLDPEDEQRLIELIQGEPKSRTLEQILSERVFDISRSPRVAIPRMSIGGVGISYDGDITVVSAQAKAGKSALIGAILAASMTESANRDTLGVEGYNVSNKALIHFDTEQSADDHDALVRRSLRRAGLALPPSWLYSYHVKGMASHEIVRLIEVACESASKKHQGIDKLIIDGTGDLVDDTNEILESKARVGWLEWLATKYDCPLVGILHLNPPSKGGEKKMTGHFGTYLERKAGTVLVLDKDANEVTSIYSKVSRKAPLLDGQGPSFSWNPEAGMHTLCKNASNAKSDAKTEDLRNLFEAAFHDCQNPHGMTWKELYDFQTSLKGMTSTTAQRRIRDATPGILKKTSAGYYQLSKA